MNRVIAFLVLIFCCLQALAQTPPVQTWYYNSTGTKTDVKERWEEDSDGLKHGKYILYGYNCGWSRTYYVDQVGYYNHGKKDGLWKYFSCAGDGEIYITGSYKNDVKIGFWKEIYDSKEKIFQEGTYINGQRNGTWINTDDTQTKKGYKVVYNDGKVISVFDDNGVNLLEAQEQEEANKKIKEEYNSCSKISDYENFRKKYPNSGFDNDVVSQINRLKGIEQGSILAKKQEDDYLNPLLQKWDSMPDTSKTAIFFNEYYTKFPNGYRKNDVKNRTDVIWNFYDEVKNKYEHEGENIGILDVFFQRYPKVTTPSLDEWLQNKIQKNASTYDSEIELLIVKNTDESLKQALAMLNVIYRCNGLLHNSYALIFSIQRSLLNWRFGNIELALNEIKIHRNDIVYFSSGKEKYTIVLKQYYKKYKLSYPNEKEVWNQIVSILND